MLTAALLAASLLRGACRRRLRMSAEGVAASTTSEAGEARTGCASVLSQSSVTRRAREEYRKALIAEHPEILADDESGERRA